MYEGDLKGIEKNLRFGGYAADARSIKTCYSWAIRPTALSIGQVTFLEAWAGDFAAPPSPSHVASSSCELLLCRARSFVARCTAAPINGRREVSSV